MTGAQKVVLVLDDSELLLKVMRKYLGAAGYRVVTARTPDELETQLKAGAPDLILLDVQMPEIFGDDVAGVLREVHGNSCPVYLLSSVDEAELARRATQAGADGYISKNEGMESLVARVRAILGDG